MAERLAADVSIFFPRIKPEWLINLWNSLVWKSQIIDHHVERKISKFQESTILDV